MTSKSDEVYDGKHCAVCEEPILAVDEVRYLPETRRTGNGESRKR